MLSDFSIHSDLLVHWTGRDIDGEYQPKWYEQDSSEIPKEVDNAYLRRLRDILNVGFWMTIQPSWILPDKSEVPEAPGLCFTQLKLSQSRTHATKYGRLGIAVKRPYLFNRSGRPVAYFQPRLGEDVFLGSCSRDLTDRRLLQFFKPMDDRKSGRMAYDLYSESEWRIIGGTSRHGDDQMVNPRNTTDTRVTDYFNTLSPMEQEKLQYLVPLDGWLAAIIYPSVRIKNQAQQDGNEVQTLIRKIARTRDHAWGVEGDNLPIELDLDLCRNF